MDVDEYPSGKEKKSEAHTVTACSVKLKMVIFIFFKLGTDFLTPNL